MSPSSAPLWRQIQKGNFTSWKKLADFLQLPEHQLIKIQPNPNFALNLPRRLAEKIEKGTLDDPILLQFLPQKKEEQEVENFNRDPVGDSRAQISGKLLHKYPGRVLLVCTSACAMHCRFCFRQHFAYDASNENFAVELAYIAADESIKEVILSGGDPLSLTHSKLSKLMSGLETIPHVKRIRFHTRFPVGIPERIDRDFLDLLESLGKQVWFVIHCNHPRELDDDVLEALKKIRFRGIPVLNQTVLLKNINDDPITLKNLSESLVDNGIFPYYLHQLDRVRGAAHFEVPEEKGLELIEAMTQSLSGYAVPKYVREVAGKSSKVLIS